MKTILGLVLIVITSFSCVAGTLHVPGDYGTISEAVEAAETGDEIRIAAGRYVEEIVLDKDVTLVGEGAELTVLGNLSAEPAVSVQGAHVELHNLSIAKALSAHFAAVHVKEESSARLQDVRVTARDGVCIGVESDSHLELLASSILDGEVGLSSLGTIIIEESEFRGNAYGIRVFGGVASLHECTFVMNGAAISTGTPQETHVTFCRFNENSVAIDAYGEAAIKGTGNAFANNDEDIQGQVVEGFRSAMPAGSETEIVFPHPEYGDLGQAILALASNGVLRLQTSSEVAEITIDKSIRIESASVDGIPELWNSAFRVVAGGRLEIEGVRLLYQYEAAIKLVETGALELLECDVAAMDYGYWYAIEMMDESRASISRSRFMLEGESTGIRVDDEATLWIEDSVIRDFDRTGIVRYGSAQIDGQGNSITGAGVALLGDIPGHVLAGHLEGTSEVVKHPGDGFSCLQAAVDAVVSGGTLIIASGEYEESLTVGKHVTVRGESADNPPVLLASGSFQTVVSLVRDADVQLENLRFQDCDYAVKLSNSGRLALSGCIFEQGYQSIATDGETNLLVTDCEFAAIEGIGIAANQTCSVVVEKSRFISCATAIQISGWAAVRVDDCQFRDNDEVVDTWDFHVLEIRNSVFRGNQESIGGVSSDYPSQLLLDGCLFEGSGSAGLSLRAANISVRDCTIRERLPDNSQSDVFDEDSYSFLASGETVELANLEVDSLSWTGITLWCRSIAMRDCAIRAPQGRGVKFSSYEDEETTFLMERTSVSECRIGVLARSQSDGRIEDCLLLDNKPYGVFIEKGAEVGGTGNLFAGNAEDVCSLSKQSTGDFAQIAPGDLERIDLTPNSPMTLEQAFQDIAEGGIIWLGDGEYPSASVARWGFEIRALPGTQPVIRERLWDFPAISLALEADLQVEGLRFAGPGEHTEKVFDFSTAFELFGESSLRLADCTIEGWSHAIDLRNRSSAFLEDCIISDARDGIRVAGTSRLEVQESTFEGITGWFSEAIGCLDSSLASVVRCEFISNDQAIALYDDSRLTMSSSVIRDNHYGLEHFDACREQAVLTEAPVVQGQGNLFEVNAEYDVCPDRDNPLWPEGFFVDD